MSAANLFVGMHAAYVLADQGFYSADGTLEAQWCKIRSSDRLHLAFTTTGRDCIIIEDGAMNAPLHDALDALLFTAADQQAFLATLPAVARAAWTELRRHVDRPLFHVCIALWHLGRKQPEGYVIGSPDCELVDYAPFTLCGVGYCSSPTVDKSFHPASGELTAAAALRLIQQQRLTPDETGAYRVGGAADLATVDAGGVRIENVCSWPDRIGESIRPRRGLVKADADGRRRYPPSSLGMRRRGRSRRGANVVRQDN